MEDSYERVGNKSDFKDGTMLTGQVKNKELVLSNVDGKI